MFEGMLPSGNDTPGEVLNNLLSPQAINLKSDLSLSQIRVIAKIYFNDRARSYREEKFGPIKALDETVTLVKELMVSYKRGSRKETIEGVKSMQIVKEELAQQQVMKR